MSHYLWMAGRSTEARTFAENAQALAEPLSDFSLRVGSNFYLGTVCLTSGDYRQAEKVLRQVVQLVDGERQRDRCGLAAFPAAMARGYSTWALTELGAFDDGITLGEEGVRIAEAFDHPYSRIVASWGPAYLHRTRGQLEQAARLGAGSVELQWRADEARTVAARLAAKDPQLAAGVRLSKLLAP